MSNNRSLKKLEQIRDKRWAELQTVCVEYGTLRRKLDDTWKSISAEKIKELHRLIDELKKRKKEAYDSWYSALNNVFDKTNHKRRKK